MSDDLHKLISTLLENRQKPFVKRILEREKYPTLDNKDGTYSTHSMAWGSTDNGHAVYPTVVYDEKTKKLNRLDNKKAFDHARKNNNFIRFDTPEDADWFSKNYKKYWNVSKEVE